MLKILTNLSALLTGAAPPSPAKIETAIADEQAALAEAEAEFQAAAQAVDHALMAGGPALAAARAKKSELETHRADLAARLDRLNIRLADARRAAEQSPVRQAADAALAQVRDAAAGLETYNAKLAPQIAELVRQVRAAELAAYRANDALIGVGLPGDVPLPKTLVGANASFQTAAIGLPSLRGAPWVEAHQQMVFTGVEPA